MSSHTQLPDGDRHVRLLLAICSLAFSFRGFIIFNSHIQSSGDLVLLILGSQFNVSSEYSSRCTLIKKGKESPLSCCLHVSIQFQFGDPYTSRLQKNWLTGSSGFLKRCMFRRYRNTDSAANFLVAEVTDRCQQIEKFLQGGTRAVDRRNECHTSVLHSTDLPATSPAAVSIFVPENRLCNCRPQYFELKA